MDRQNITVAKLADDIRKATALVERAIDLTDKGRLINLCSVRSHIEKICRNARDVKNAGESEIANLLFALDNKLCDFNTKLSEQFGWLNEQATLQNTPHPQEDN